MKIGDTPRAKAQTEFYQRIGANVRLIREGNRYSQEEFGKLFNISRVAVNCIEAGKQRLSVFDYAQITQYFNVSFDEFQEQNFEYEPKEKKTPTAKKIDRYYAEVMAYGVSHNVDVVITLSDIASIQHRGVLSGFRPIPLTEEWLVKAGFEKDDLGYWYHPKLGSMFLKLPYLDSKHYLFKSIQGTPITAIEKIHHLQNIFYDICGEELLFSNF